MNRKQTTIGFVLCVLLAIFGVFLNSRNPAMPLHLITGLGFGYVLAKSNYGFAGGVKLMYMSGDGILSKALLLMLAFTLIMTTGLQWKAAQGGAVASYLVTEGVTAIPGTGNIGLISLNLIIGGLLFGAGMIFAGGCASGTLTGIGSGWGGSLVVLIFFAVGGLLGDIVMGAVGGGFMDKGPRVYLPHYFGYIGAFVISITLILICYTYIKYYESKRKREGTLAEIQEPESPKISGDFKFLSEENYNTLLGGSWKRKTGAFMVSAMFMFVLLTTGSNWGVSGPYAVWGARFLQIFGINPETGPMAGTFKAAAGGIMNHAVSVRNIGIILGSTVAMLFSGYFEIDFGFTFTDAIYYALGGILMGIGAKMARGCNVGAFYSAISTFSLSGWVFMLACIFGGLFVLKTFAGKFNLIPVREQDK